MTTVNTQKTAKNENGKKLPTHVAKAKRGYGRNTRFERIGVAWLNDDGSLFINLHGTQVVSGFMLYEINSNEAQDEEPNEELDAHNTAEIEEAVA